MGRLDRPKRILKVSPESSRVIPIKQEADYYFIKGNYYQQKNKVNKALLFFKKAIEMEPGDALYHYNLACLLSKIGRFAEANRIFNHIVTELDPSLTECYFLMAINYGLMEDLELTRQYLSRYIEADPDGDLADEAGDLLDAFNGEEPETYCDCQEQLTSRENSILLQEIAGLTIEQLQESRLDNNFWFLLQRGLYQGSDQLKEAIVRLCGKIKSARSFSLLKEFVCNPWVKERLRQVALLELRCISPGESFRVFYNGRFVESGSRDYPLCAPVWKDEWQQVLNCVFENMHKNSDYCEEFFEDVQAIWLDFINHVYPNMPRIVKPQTWAAGLEYCLARFHFLNVTQKELALEYGVCITSVGDKYKHINRILKIEQKAYRNMIAFLAQQGRGQN